MCAQNIIWVELIEVEVIPEDNNLKALVLQLFQLLWNGLIVQLPVIRIFWELKGTFLQCKGPILHKRLSLVQLSYIRRRIQQKFLSLPISC